MTGTLASPRLAAGKRNRTREAQRLGMVRVRLEDGLIKTIRVSQTTVAMEGIGLLEFGLEREGGKNIIGRLRHTLGQNALHNKGALYRRGRGRLNLKLCYCQPKQLVTGNGEHQLNVAARAGYNVTR